MPVSLDVDKITALLAARDPRAIARAITLVEENDSGADHLLASLDNQMFAKCLVLGITGPPGVGKSTLTSQLIVNYRKAGKRVGVVAVDPSSPISGGAILGDRVRMMEHAVDKDVVIRSMATRGRLGGVCAATGAAVRIMAAAGCQVIIIETVGVGQSEVDVIKLADLTLMVAAPGMGDDVQAMKAGIMEVADLFVMNKADHPGAESAIMDIELTLRERSVIASSFNTVNRTIATEGIGVDDLARQIELMAASFRKSGDFQKRRAKAQRLEALDWAIELIRPKLAGLIAKENNLAELEPRLRAKKILENELKNLEF